MATEMKLLEVGDKIAEYSRYVQKAKRIIEVTRVTKTQAMCNVYNLLGTATFELKLKRECFNSSRLYEIGENSHNQRRYRLATKEDFEDIHRQPFIESLSKIDWAIFPIETLEQVYHLVNQPVTNQ